MHKLTASVLVSGVSAASGATQASGRPLGIDYRLHYDNSGIWKRINQTTLAYGTILTVASGAPGFGGNDQPGNTFWPSVDAMVLIGVTVTTAK